MQQNLTFDEQFAVMSKMKAGVPIYYRYSLSNRDDDWKIVPKDHVFDFTDFEYAIGAPRLWKESLKCQTMKDAFVSSLEQMKNKMYTTEISTLGQTTDKFKAIAVRDLYELWNYAVYYGRKSKKDTTCDITKETNPFENC